MRKLLGNWKVYWIFVIPSIIFVTWFLILPLLQVFYFSFCKYSFIGVPKWIGLKNYESIFADDPIFHTAVKNTAFFTIFNFIIQQALGVLIAGILMNTGKGKNFFKNVYYLPVVLSASALGLMWMFIFDGEMGINNILANFGIQGPYWLNEPDGFICLPMIVVCIVALWQYLGQYMMLYIAQMSGISSEIYEAACIDGAGKVKIFFRITLPLLKPMFIITSSINVIGSLKCFDIVYSMTKGGPDNKTSVLATLLYEDAFKYHKMGYACGIGVILFLVAVIATIILNYGIKVEDYEM